MQEEHAQADDELRGGCGGCKGGGGSGSGGGGIREEDKATAALFADPKSGIKLCPQCSTPLVHGFGCYKIKCRCSYKFCWKCLAKDSNCECTPHFHGFWDNTKGTADFSK